MAVAGSIDILTGVNTKGLSTGLAKSGSMLKSFGSTFGPALAAGFAAAGGAAILNTFSSGVSQVVGGLTDLTRNAFSTADVIGKTTASIGISAESLTALRYAAKLSDVEIGTLDGGLKKLNVNLATAASTGKGKTADALRDIGLSAVDLVQLDPGEAFKQIAQGISQLPNPAAQAAASMAIFGKSGVEMLPLLQSGASGIEALTTRAQELGAVMADSDVSLLNQANDSIDDMGVALQSVGNMIAVEVAPYVVAFSISFIDAIKSVKALASESSGAFDTVLKWTARAIDFTVWLGKKWLWVQQGIWEGVAAVVEFVSAITPLSHLTGIDAIVKDGVKDFRAFNAGLAEVRDGLSDTAGTDLVAWVNGVRNGANGATDSINRMPIALDEVTEATKKTKAAGEDLIKTLQTQLQTFGLTSREVEVFKLRQQEASITTINTAVAISKQLDALDKAKESRDKMASDAKSIWEQTRTPLEKYRMELQKVNALQQSGALDKDTAARQRGGLLKDLVGEKTPQFSAALDFNSAGARSVILANQQNNNPQQRMAENIKGVLLEAKKQTAFMAKIASPTEVTF